MVHQRVELRWNRDSVWIEHHGQTVATYGRCYEPGTWQPAPRMRPEPPPTPIRLPVAGPAVAAPALADYAELCA